MNLYQNHSKARSLDGLDIRPDSVFQSQLVRVVVLWSGTGY